MSICLKRIEICQEWDSNLSLHSETRRFVITSLVKDFDFDFDFESDTLEGSAILTTHVREGSVKYCELMLGGTIYVNLQRIF